MRTLARFAVTIVAAAFFAGCGAQSGGSPVPLGAAAQSKAHEASAYSGDLLFTSGSIVAYNGTIFLWSYPDGKFVKRLRGYYGGIGMCSDKSGNVWVAEGSNVDEFNHDGKGIGGLRDGTGLGAVGCAVDPTSGDVAVTSGESGTILVFPNGTGSPKSYSAAFTWGWFCGYDDQGNLFADGSYGNSGSGVLVELKKGAKSVTTISLDHSISGSGAVQWDGKYVAVEAAKAPHTVTIYQISVSGSSGTVASSTQLTSPARDVGVRQFWIQDGRILRAVGGAEHDSKVGVWKYPQGGKPQRFIYKRGRLRVHRFTGLTVSVAPSRSRIRK
jgi:hypothetical protein